MRVKGPQDHETTGLRDHGTCLKSSNIQQPTSREHSRAGFTLIELVISAALMAMILGASYVCLTAAISGKKLIEPRADVIQNARVAMAMISGDLRSACPLSKDFEFLGMHRMIEDLQADNLDFATHNYTPRRPREADYCQISYFVEKEGDSSTVSLYRRPTPGANSIHRRRNARRLSWRRTFPACPKRCASRSGSIRILGQVLETNPILPPLHLLNLR